VPCHTCDFVARLWRATLTQRATNKHGFQRFGWRCVKVARQSRETKSQVWLGTNSRCVLYIKAGAANMAGAWFIHRLGWPVRPVHGLYRPNRTCSILLPNRTCSILLPVTGTKCVLWLVRESHIETELRQCNLVTNEMVILGSSIDTENLRQYTCLLCVISDRFLTICNTHINMYLAGLHVRCNYESVYESSYQNNINSTNYLVVIFRYFMLKQQTA